MAFCPKFTTFSELVRGINHNVLINKDKEKDLRYDIWGTTPAEVRNLFEKGTEALPGGDSNSPHVIDKVEGALKRILASDKEAKNFQDDIINDESSIAYSIALHEIMESIKGEADKARNLGIPVESIAADGILPTLPMSRVAASIGRKIAFQQGHRFKSNKSDPKTAVDIETMYYAVGNRALVELQEKGYVTLHENPATIKDYIEKSEIKQEFPKLGITTTKVQGISLVESKFGIEPDTEQAKYFLNRTAADLTNTELGVTTDMLSAVRNITQPATITLPDKEAKMTMEELAELDDPRVKIPKKIAEARKKLYDTPLYVNNSVHDLMMLLSKESQASGKSASTIIKEKFGAHPSLINSLFGLKRSQDYSVDKKESVRGQNLSKTTPMDDLVENYHILQDGAIDPAALHMALKIGRNERLYYTNSVLNPHGSKQSRYMLTPGKYTIDSRGDDFNYLVYNMAEALGDEDLTFKDFTEETGSKLDKALAAFKKYENAKNIDAKLGLLSRVSAQFPGVDYVTLLTTLKAVEDIRNPVDGKVTTEFNASADATASGGTLTFLQALGTNPNVEGFLKRIGLLKGQDPDDTIDDLYGIMTEAIQAFVKDEDIPALESMMTSPETDARRALIGDTVDLLFGTETKDVRELSKDPTMTFVYGQGRKGAIETMSRSLADRIIDNLEDPKVQKFLTRLYGNKDHRTKDDADLYKDIVRTLTDKGIPGQLYDIMDSAVNVQYLKEYKQRSVDISKFVAKLDIVTQGRFKILPAIMAGEDANLSNIKEYGMPLTKVVEVNNPTEGPAADTVLTQEQKLTKTVADVSPIHGIDAAQLYGSLRLVMGENGVVVVHDDVRGTVQDVRAVEAEYLKQTKEIIGKYDIHQQIMNSVAAYSPEIANSPEFKKLKNSIDQDVAEKQRIMESLNMDTHALIGHGVKYQEFANADGETSPAEKAKSTAKPTAKDSRPKAAATPSPTAMDKLVELADKSDIIKRFILMANNSNIEFGKNNKFKSRSDTIKISKKATQENIEHEIIHANTVAFIAKAFQSPNTQENREVRYFKKSIDQIANSNIEMSEEAQARMDYITAQVNDVDQVAEFVAVMSTEEATATELYRVLSKETPSPSLMKRINAFVKKVVNSFVSVADEDFESDVDLEKLYNALETTVRLGESQRELNYAEASKYLQGVKKSYGSGPVKDSPAFKGARGKLNYANYAIARMLTASAERRGKKVIGNIHDELMDRAPMYEDVANKLAGIYDSSEQLQQLVHTITGEGVDKTKKADILAKFAQVMGQQSEIINMQSGKFHTLLSHIDEKERKTIGRFVTEMPLHDYFVLAGEFDTVEAIASEVTALEKEVNKNSPGALKNINDLIAWNVKGEDTNGTIYNLEQEYPGQTPNALRIKKLMALKSIQEIGAKKFVKLLENEELVDLIRDEVVANKLSLDKVDGAKHLNDSLVMEQYKEPFTLKTVNERAFRQYEEGENTGWEVLRRPEKGGLGIVYRKVIDASSIPGAYTDTKLQSSDIEVYGKQATTPGVVKAPDGTNKLRLTKKEKMDLGMVDDFSQSLVKSTAHNMAVQESQIIRDELLKKDTRMVVGQNTDKLVGVIESENVDNPWFVKLEEGMEYDDLPAKVKARYAKVGERASNVENFNEEVDLVRKDISHWLMGGSSKSLFTNPKMKWAMRIVKGLVAGSKIGMVVMNPIKIANDNISNVSYLGVMGVDPLFVAKNYKAIATDYQEYTDIQRQILQSKVQLTARPDSEAIKKKIKNLQKRLGRNSLGDLADKGFINSLGSDLVSKNADTLSGLQADMHTALHYLLTNKEGKKNYVSHFIMQLQNLGFDGEDFLTYIGNIAQRADKGKSVKKELDQVAARLKEIRTDEDIVNYVSQYTNSPGSEAVRLGSAATDLTDVLAKETLYRHLVENEGASPEAARIKVLDSFPDYKENMPLAVKQLSDVGIIMFPSFWLRIQKVIYRMARDKPINLATELMLEEAFGSNINTIVDANIINKSNSFGGLFHPPGESVGLGSVVPMHIW